jgi:AraC family transcriptional regulator of adaptative response/methylated-DNA-[protein]-cysteine methyltransferase
LKFIDEERKLSEFQQFSRQWNFARIVHNPKYTQEVVRKIFHPAKINSEKLHLLVQGTDFQIKVWEALVKIPFGTVSSFQQIANKMGQPAAVRSVGTAVGKTSILYLIPCHRIISKDGTMGQYHFGKIRKQAMIGWEMSKLVQ